MDQKLSESAVREACLRMRVSRVRNSFGKCQIHFPNLQKGVVGVQMQLRGQGSMPSVLGALGFAQTGSRGHTPIISEVGKQRQKDQNFKASLGYVRPSSPVVWIPACYLSLPTMQRGR